MRKLEIGSGNKPREGYEHLDINPKCPCVEYVSEMDDIPVEDNTFDEVLSIHVIEHQPWKNTLNTLEEWFRVLKPGGKMKIATPNLRWICESYMSARQKNGKAFVRNCNQFTDKQRAEISLDRELDVGLWTNFKIMSGGGQFNKHFACYDATMLKTLLKKAGASSVKVINDNDSLVVEAIKRG